MKISYLLFAILIIFSGCYTYQAQSYDFPRPVDTTDKPIIKQSKKTYNVQGVYANNQFAGARLNNFTFVKDNHFQATIEPENKPINFSPYYAFKLWSNEPKTIKLELNYTHARHRYQPKISTDGKTWQLLSKDKVELAKDSVNAYLTLGISSDTLWVAAQEVTNSNHVKTWCIDQATHKDATLITFGKSKLGRELFMLDIHDGAVAKEDVIVILSRQHPPEVTGYFAMQAFIDEVLADNPLANDFRKKYRILVFPLMNPDGVDLGHWRHNAGGIDLNRDWAYYHQPETRQVADKVVELSKKSNSNVILGLDFHSTWYDIYYTNKAVPKHLPHFKDYWLHGVHETIGEDINERPSNVGSPVSKGWFATQFDAVGITYEIGDETPRDYIKTKGKAAATEMMELLIFKSPKK